MNGNLTITHPQLCKEWDYSRNKLPPDNYSFGSNKKVYWICDKHQSYLTEIYSRVIGCGCRKCGTEATAKKLSMNVGVWIEKCNIIHNNYYDYSKSTYINTHTKLIIICPKHKEFFQTPNKHLSGRGCRKCADIKGKQKRSLTQEEFLFRAYKIHKNYDYDKVIYINYNTPIIITCKTHGDFKQKPSDHLPGRGCKNCSGSVSKVSNTFLDLLSIKNREAYINTNFKTLKVDGYDSSHKIVYYFHGDYWHAHPTYKLCGNFENKHPVINKTNQNIYVKTLFNEELIKSFGYKLVVIWEHEFNRIKEMYKDNLNLFKYHLQSFVDYQLMYYQSEFSNTEVQTKFLPVAPVTVSSTS